LGLTVFERGSSFDLVVALGFEAGRVEMRLFFISGAFGLAGGWFGR
jgi:hypothetical protein